MAALSISSFSSLVGSIYECVLDPAQWDRTLSQIAGTFACEKAVLSLNDLKTGRMLIKKSVGWEPRWLDERTRHLPEIHDVLSSWLLRQSQLDSAFVASREIPADALEGSPYVQRCLKPQGIVDVAHFPLIWSLSHFSELVLFWQEAHGVMTQTEIELGERLLPHLRRAITISNVLDVRTIEHARIKEALDALSQGVVLTDDRGAVVHVNRSAGQMLQNGGPVGVAQGVLFAKSRAADAELSKAISLVGRDEAAMGKTGTAIRLSARDQPPVYARVLPIGAAPLREKIRVDAVAAIFIDAAPKEGSGVDAVSSAYGLTYAETRVLDNLATGRTLSGTAAQLGIAVTTARTHLAHIFLKTGVSRQADLMRLTMQADRI
jgi:DNA-binding CsgD family transcriptional regulator/PAS domain-containing protein